MTPRRLAPLAALAALLVTALMLRGLLDPRQSVELPDASLSRPTPMSEIGGGGGSKLHFPRPSNASMQKSVTGSVSRSGTVKPPGSNYTRMLVVASTKAEDTTWVKKELPGLEAAIYVVDNPQAPLHPPLNKGHELMVFLSFIIDRYDRLPDIVIFLHAHRFSYHNNEIQGADAVKMIKALSSERVTREGYMNLRCTWDPGCPAHLHPLAKELDFHHMQPIMAEQWTILFPDAAIPETIAQPCCSQFAVSRERIRSVPLYKFIAWRDWLLRTPVTDYYSGRLWEYLWQYVFTGKSVVCPQPHICYCDGFGLCFEGEQGYKEVDELLLRRGEVQRQLEEWEQRAAAVRKAKEAGAISKELEAPEKGRDTYLLGQRDALNREIDVRTETARQKGKDPAVRAKEVGRAWQTGDGF